MTITDFSALPSSPLATIDADLCQTMQVVFTPLDDVNATEGFIGSQLVGFTQKPKVYFPRFELNLPVGAIITGLCMRFFSDGPGTLGPMDLTGGFCKRQGGANAWETAGGVGAWAIGDIPFGEANTFVGPVEDDTVWVGDAPAFEDVSFTLSVGGPRLWDFGEGTFAGTGTNDVTGMIAQLQSYLDDPAVEATRGDTVAGSISVLFQIYRHFIGTANQSQPIRTNNNISSASHPVLRVEWDRVGNVKSRGDLASVVQSRGSGIDQVRSRGDLLSSVDSRGDMK